MENRTYYIYKHTAPNKKVYIGITSMIPKERWKYGRGYANNAYFFNAILKYGWANFTHEILFSNLSKEEAQKKEIELIALYKSTDKKHGYNILIGGQCGRLNLPVSAETRAKISNANKGHKSYIKGGHISEEHRQKISQALTGEKHNNYGKTRSEETKAKISNSHKKPVLQYSLDGTFIKEWACTIDIEKELGISNSQISNVCNGKKRTAHGFVWKYKTIVE